MTSGERDIPKVQEQLFATGASGARKYADLVIGRPGLWALVKYECVMLASAWVPGALGLVLRKRLYPRLLGRCGRGVVFGVNVTLRHPHKITIGDDVVIDDNCLLDAKGSSNQGIAIGNRVFIGRNTILSCKNGDIELADGANIGFNCEIFSASRVSIGSRSLLAAYCYLVGGDHDFSQPDLAVLDQQRISKGIALGEGTWLGAGVKVLDGVEIQAHAVVGAGAVVRTDIPAYGIAVGLPARVIGFRAGAPSARAIPPASSTRRSGERGE